MGAKRIPFENKCLLPNSKPFEFEFLSQLICDTQQQKYEIKREWENMLEFLSNFPEHAEAFSQEFILNRKFVIDSYQKVYNQLLNTSINGKLGGIQTFPLFYYSYEPSMHEYWDEKNVPVGEYDDNGILNTRCCVLLKVVEINVSAFVVQYFGLLN